jgi:hypothetical protein
VDPGISATVSGLTVTGGSSEAGGGINNGGTLVLANSMVSGNTAATGAIGDGGGIYNSGTLTVRDSRVFDNETNLGGMGGGIDNVTGATLTVIGSTISDNASNSHGVEGIGGGIDNSGTMTLDSSTVAGDAEGMFLGVVNSGSATVTNSTLADGFSNLGGTTLIVDSTVDQSSNSSATLDLEASIMVGGCSGSTPVTDFGYNIDDNGTCGFSAPSISDSSTVDGSLGPLAANGGPTETMALTAGSPAIDKVTAGDCPLTDQRGATRTAPCDIGAYDTDGNLVVTSLKPPKGKVGKKITIKGTQLTGATVSFNGTVAVITYDTGTRMITSVPAGATSGPVTVTTATGGTVMVAKVFKVT